MKLTLKLTLAFLLVSLIAIGLAAVFVWSTTSTEFAKYLVDQRQAQFVAVASEYYQTHSGWAGVDTALREQGLLPPLPQPGAKPPDPQPFALINQNREVIVAGGDYQPGQKLQKGVIARGIDIEIKGVVVGTVLITGQSPIRSTIEDKYLAGVNQSLVIAAVGGALIALVLGMYLARTLTRPVRELTQATRAMAQGNFDQRIATRSKDEIGELAESFNQMSADLAFANQSRRQMTADIAHDLRNPLTVIHGYLEALKDGKLSSTPERYETMLAEVTQLQRLVDDLRTLSLADTGELALYRQPVQAANLAAQVAAAYRHQAEQQGVRLLTEIGANLSDASLDPDRIVQVLGNLVSNALRYTPAGGVITLSADMTGEHLLLSVRDTGMGIPAEVLPRIFERSYRGDASRSGSESGLGLAIAKSIVELHGGTIRAESNPQGSQFIIELPTKV